ncbi:carbohydrate porin [Sphingopyxis sp.]|uniref:carbohydrate porin n=1 Tax=Sphingopyxis sp. TaxID=1908224 RepID=UPI002625A75C|nr:carbohydrate porin [Sphingopyxis sp.]MCW0197777.1 carbohydrate porin [Sphingopyxis sp.]
MLIPAAMLALAGAPAAADAALPHPGPAHHVPHSHTHPAGEIDEDHGPLLLQISYTGEIMGNAAGGIRRGVRYLDNLDMVFEADMERALGWTGAQIHVYGLYNNGRSISGLAGDTQAVSNIETGVSALRLYEAWIDQRLGSHVSLRAGLYDLNSEFDSIEAAGLFVGSAHGIGTDIAQTGRGGPSIFPSTALAARLQVAPASGWVLRAALLDGVPGDPDHPRRTAIRLGGGDGALMIGEVEAPFGEGKLLLGHWHYTARFDRNDSGAGRGNSGTYVRAAFPLAALGERQVDGFLRLGTASGRFNMFDRFASAGLTFSGWIRGRDDDAFGIALAGAFTADSYRLAMGAKASELAIEATYHARVNEWLSVQPSLHYVRNPSAGPAIPDALLIGIRFEVSHSLFGF